MIRSDPRRTAAARFGSIRARYYDPATATFPSLDPFEGMAARPMSLNGYLYVEGDPVNMTDATGMQAERVDSVCDLPPGAVSPYIYRTICPLHDNARYPHISTMISASNNSAQ